VAPKCLGTTSVRRRHFTQRPEKPKSRKLENRKKGIGIVHDSPSIKNNDISKLEIIAT
jgi:hypothetical protein